MIGCQSRARGGSAATMAFTFFRSPSAAARASLFAGLILTDSAWLR